MTNTPSHLLDVALLGTEKAALQIAALDAAVQPVAEAVGTDAMLDAEDRLLHTAAVATAYRRAGVKPHAEPAIPSAAPEETLPYATPEQNAALKAVLGADLPALLRLWLRLCEKSGRIVQPEMLPQIFSYAERSKAMRPLVQACAGARGAWLAGFNHAWKFADEQPAEVVWAEGAPSARAAVLEGWWVTDPERARRALQETWPKEDATSKAVLLGALRGKATTRDLPWLESLTAEKGKKVTEALGAVLAGILGSSVQKRYWAVVSSAFEMQEKGGVLGLGKKRVLRIVPPKDGFDELYATGLFRLTKPTQPPMTESEAVLYQLLSFIPPDRVATHLSLSPAGLIEAFRKSPDGHRYITAIGMAASRYRAASWAPLFTDDPASYYSELLPLLTPADREKYFLRMMEHNAIHGAQALQESPGEEWSLSLAQSFFKAAAREPYTLHKGVLAEVLDRIPVTAKDYLALEPSKQPYEAALWEKNKEVILTGLLLKTRIQQAFVV